MECQRCQGLMVPDRAYDLLDSDVHCDVWRCVACGNVIDAKILHHRDTQPNTMSVRKKTIRRQDPIAA